MIGSAAIGSAVIGSAVIGSGSTGAPANPSTLASFPQWLSRRAGAGFGVTGFGAGFGAATADGVVRGGGGLDFVGGAVNGGTRVPGPTRSDFGAADSAAPEAVRSMETGMAESGSTEAGSVELPVSVPSNAASDFQ